jgi:hypothetical protein
MRSSNWGREIRVSVEVVPKRSAENFVIGPAVCHSPGEAVEIESNMEPLQFAGGVIERKAARLGFLEDAFAHQVA